MQRCMVGLLGIRTAAVGGGTPPPRLLALLDRGIIKLAKTLVHIVETHPWSCFASGMLSAHLDTCWSYATSPSLVHELTSTLHQRLSVHVLRFLLAV